MIEKETTLSHETSVYLYKYMHPSDINLTNANPDLPSLFSRMPVYRPYNRLGA
jgi:hypothetical protein